MLSQTLDQIQKEQNGGEKKIQIRIVSNCEHVYLINFGYRYPLVKVLGTGQKLNKS